MIFLIVITVVFFAPLVTGACAVCMFGRRKNREKPVLLLHTITGGHHAHFSHYSPQKFIRFIEELHAQNLHSRTLSEIALQPLSSIDPAITFDDGFESFYSNALSVLDDYHMKVTVFPIAGYVGKTSRWDVLPRQQHLSAPQIREISDRGHEIGSHTVTHVNLTFLSDSDVVRELADSKKILEDITGKPVVSLSFPFGFWNRRVWKLAQEMGYRHGTCYRNHKNAPDGLIPVRGIYSFDTVQDVFDKVVSPKPFSNAYARCRIMSHFAKGTPLWKFASNYSFFR
jgi:peptidoglycan/xylan/chitin deacetylase (PgdA/CDA1 family)